MSQFLLDLPLNTSVYTSTKTDLWSTHTKTKRLHLDLKLRSMTWLLGRKSQLLLANKLLLYKCMLKPVWTYGVQLWGCVKPSHTQIIQRLQSKILRSITNVPWYVSNFTLHRDLHIPFVVSEIRRLFHLYHQRLVSHHNPLVAELAVLPLMARRLKRQWPTDLLNDPLYDKSCVLCITLLLDTMERHSWKTSPLKFSSPHSFTYCSTLE